MIKTMISIYLFKKINKVIIFLKLSYIHLLHLFFLYTPSFLKREIPEKNFSAGLLGCGHIALSQYIHALNRKKIDLSIKSIYNRNFKNSKIFQKKLAYKSKYFTSFDEFLSSGINSVIITTPNYTHYEYILKSIENNMHVFCEKPLTNCLSESIHLKELTGDSEKILMVGFNLRYSKIYNKLNKLIKDNVVGETQKVSVYHYAGLEEHIRNSSWLNDLQKSGGGVLINVGIHSINLLIDLFGNVNTCHAKFDNLILPIGCGEDHVFCSLQFENNIKANLNISYLNNKNINKNFIFFVECSNGSIVCDFKNNYIKIFDKNNYLNRFYFSYELAHEYIYNELMHFASCIENNKNPNTDIDDFINTFVVIERLYKYR